MAFEPLNWIYLLILLFWHENNKKSIIDKYFISSITNKKTSKIKNIENHQTQNVYLYIYCNEKKIKVFFIIIIDSSKLKVQ